MELSDVVIFFIPQIFEDFFDFDFDLFSDWERRENVVSECLEEHSYFY